MNQNRHQINPSKEPFKSILADYYHNHYASPNSPDDPIDENAEIFARYLRTQRHKAQLTQQELAEKSGLSAVTIHALEKGLLLSTQISTETLKKLASALDMDIARFAAMLDREISIWDRSNTLSEIQRYWTVTVTYFGSPLKVAILLLLIPWFLLVAWLYAGQSYDFALDFIMVAYSGWNDSDTGLLPASIDMSQAITHPLSTLPSLSLPVPNIGYSEMMLATLILLSAWFAISQGDVPRRFIPAIYGYTRKLVYTTFSALIILSNLALLAGFSINQGKIAYGAWYSVDSSGVDFSSGSSFTLYSNPGQSIVGTSSNSNYQLTSNYDAFFRRDIRPVVLIIASLDNDLDFYWEDVINDAEKAAGDGNHVRLLIDGAGDENSYAFDVLSDTNPFCPSIKSNDVSCKRYKEGVNMETWTEDITHPSSIYRFITEAMIDYPHADSVTLSLIGHGAGWSANVQSVQPRGWGGSPRGWRGKDDPWPDRPDIPNDYVSGGGFLWDDFPNEHGATSLSITDLRRILEGVYEKTGRKIDLVYFDACSMGMAEVAYELKDTVRYVLASESMSWTTLIYDQLIPAVKRGMDGREIGEAWLKLESDRLDSSYGYPFILALYDQSRLNNLATAMEALGITMSSVLSTDKNLISDAVTAAMRVESYYNGEINTQDSYVDIEHLATQLMVKFNNSSAVYDAAKQVNKAVNTVIIDKKHRSGNFVSTPAAKYRRNFNSSSGMSVYFPSHHDEAKRKSFYTPEHLQWTADTGWHNFLAGWWSDSTIQAVRITQFTMLTCNSTADCPALARSLPGPGLQGTFDSEEIPRPRWMPLIPRKVVCISSTSSGKVGTLRFRDEDIVCHKLPTGEVTLLFDGSAQGLPTKADINAFHVREDGSILMSFDHPFNISSLGRVDDSDIVRFIPETKGKGTWEYFLIGKRAQLTKDAEDIDAIFELPDGRIVVSTLGTAYVRGVRNIKHTELFVFTPEQLGNDTKGTWSHYFVSPDEGLKVKDENLWSATYDEEEVQFYLSACGNFHISGLSDKNSEVFSRKENIHASHGQTLLKAISLNLSMFSIFLIIGRIVTREGRILLALNRQRNIRKTS